MDNRDLFNFKFVDRDKQKKDIINLISGKTKSNVLWIDGPHGVGKSFLLDHINEFAPYTKTVYLDINAEDKNPNCLLSLLQTIGKNTKFSFLKFFKENYLEIIKIVKDAAIFATERLSGIDLSVIVDSMFDSSKLFISKKQNANEQQNSIKMLGCYINEILKDNGLLIILDNFSLCDKNSLNIILDLVVTYLDYNPINENKIYFIFSTTTETNNENPLVANSIKERIPVEVSDIRKFSSVEYFTDILGNIFDLQKVKAQTINDIFIFCDGNPQKLHSLIHKIYDKKGITFYKNSSKAILDESVVIKIISYGTVEFKLSDLSPSERIIVSIIVSFGRIMTVNFLINITKYILSELEFYPYSSENEIKTAIYSLINGGKIKLIKHNNKSCIKMEHDIVYHSIKQQLNLDPFIVEINANIYKFLMAEKSFFLSEGYNENDYLDSLATHAFLSETGNWITLNIECGKNKYKAGLYTDAKKYFDRVSFVFNKPNYIDALIFADCYYQTGDYGESERILNNVYQTSKQPFSFEAYCLYAKVENLLLNKEKAAFFARCASEKDNISDIQKLVAKKIEMQCLINTKDKREIAKKIFDKIKSDSNKEVIDTIEFCRFLLSTVEFYNGASAQNDLKQAEKIALCKSDQFVLGEIYFNMGFDYFWEKEFKEAKSNFIKSYNYLIKVKPHESIYPLNNLASYYLIKGNTEKAMFCLNNAYLWVTSNYAKFVIKTQMMICYALDNNKKCLVIADELIAKYMKGNYTDICLKIKLFYNLCFVYNKFKIIEKRDYYYNQVTTLALNVNNEILPHSFITQLSKTNTERNIEIKTLNNFDPWLLTLNH